MAAAADAGAGGAKPGALPVPVNPADRAGTTDVPMEARLVFLLFVYSAVAFAGPLALLIQGRGGAFGPWVLAQASMKDASLAIPEVLSGMLPVAAIGTAMGALHSLASLSKRAGERTLHRSWTLFYIARPLSGAGVALATYLLLVSGVGGFQVQSDLAQLAWGALAGLYSQPALDKLRDVFATLLRSDKEPNAKDAGNTTAGDRVPDA